MLPDEWRNVIIAFFPSALFAAFGGFVRLAMRGKPIAFSRAIGTVAVAVFTGLMVAILARDYGLSWGMTVVLAGLSGVSGKSILSAMTSATERLVSRFAERYSPDEKDKP